MQLKCKKGVNMLIIFILELLFGSISVIFMILQKKWESRLFLVLTAMCVVASRMI